jgi:hypothetical protein
VLADPAGEAEARDPPDAGEPGQREDDARGADPGHGDDDQARLQPAADGADRGGDRGERRQRDAVEQAEQEEREGDGADAGSATAAAADDGDAQNLVEAAGQRDAADRGGAAGGGERQHRRALVAAEQVLPAPRLRGVGAEEGHGGEPDEPEVGAMERPAGAREVPHGQAGHGQREQDERRVEDPLPRHVGDKSAERRPT